MNTKYCNKTNSIKYLFKYLNKGPNRATLKISNSSAKCDKSNIIDEIHRKWPSIQKLTFHHVDQQSTLFKDDHDINIIFNIYEKSNTIFLALFEANKIYVEGQNLTYFEFPTKFVLLAKEKE